MNGWFAADVILINGYVVSENVGYLFIVSKLSPRTSIGIPCKVWAYYV